jgi:NADH-quinone oxidoreductase subunit N
VLENNGACQKISDLAGLWRRSRLLTVTLLVFILSLAGVPPLAGFFAKFYVFLDALRLANAAPGAIGTTVFWLVLLGVAMSAVALYYYLQILKAAFIAPPADEQAPAPVKVSWPAGLALVLAALGLVALGVFQ